MKEKIEGMKEWCIIEKSLSSFINPLVITKKQIPLECNSKQFTALLHESEVYQFCVLLFGLWTSVDSVSGMVRQILRGDVSGFADHYFCTGYIFIAYNSFRYCVT